MIHHTFHLALRRLRRRPGFSALTVVTLALGIGATVGIFAVVHGVLLQPLPFAEPDRLVALSFAAPGIEVPDLSCSEAFYLYFRGRKEAFREVAVYNDLTANLTGAGAPERLLGFRVSGGFFGLLGATPILGRPLLEADTRPGAPPVVVLTEGLWRRRFGADPRVVGRTIELNGVATEVVGVMPAGLRLPRSDTTFWAPLEIDPAAPYRGQYYLTAIARLRDGITLRTARHRVAEATRGLAEAFPGYHDWVLRPGIGFRTELTPLREKVVGSVERTLWLLFGGVGIVLLVAGANVTNLLLVRSEGRQRELAICAALGAGRGRLAVEVLVESTLLAAAAGALGTLVATFAVDALLAVEASHLPRAAEVHFGPPVIAFAILLSLGAGVLAGALAAWRYSRTSTAGLGDEGRSATGGRTRRRARRLLVGAEVALALVLVACSGLFLRSFRALVGVDPGFEAPQALTFRVRLPELSYSDPAAAAAFHRQVLERLAALPGVVEVGGTSHLPMSGSGNESGMVREGVARAEGEAAPVVAFRHVTPGYLQAMGIPLVAGRSLTWDDVENRRPVVVVSRDLAERWWPGEDPLGGRLGSGDGPWYTVVGVSGPVHDYGVEEPTVPMRYLPLLAPPEGEAFSGLGLSYVVRSTLPTDQLAPQLRRIVAAVDPSVPLARVETLEALVAADRAQAAFAAVLLGLSSVLALALGAVGVYGVISYAVSRRTREIGIRMALGARRRDIGGMVLGEGLAVVGAGVAVGLAGALAVARLLRGLLFGVSPTDPLVLAGVTLLVLAISAAATWLPARRASRVAPVEALRES